jgi:hypothetical protein
LPPDGEDGTDGNLREDPHCCLLIQPERWETRRMDERNGLARAAFNPILKDMELQPKEDGRLVLRK